MDNKPKNKEKQKPGKQLNTYVYFSSIAIQMIAIIGVGTFVGVKLDEKLPNEHSLYTIIFSLTSVILAIVFVIRRIIVASKND